MRVCAGASNNYYASNCQTSNPYDSIDFDIISFGSINNRNKDCYYEGQKENQNYTCLIDH